MPAKPIQPPTEKNVKRVIESLLPTNGLMVLVGLYFNGFPDTDFAGHLFDTLSDNPPEEVVASDLVAVSLLDVNFGAKATDSLLNKGLLNSHLRIENLPTDLDLWNTTADQIKKLYAAREALKKFHGVGPVKASKLLARKRPRLAPITDRHIQNFFDCKGWDFLGPLASCLSTSPELIDEINKLSPAGSSHSPTTLRLLDVAIWMAKSTSKSAELARDAAFGDKRPLDFIRSV